MQDLNTLKHEFISASKGLSDLSNSQEDLDMYADMLTRSYNTIKTQIQDISQLEKFYEELLHHEDRSVKFSAATECIRLNIHRDFALALIWEIEEDPKSGILGFEAKLFLDIMNQETI